MLSRIQTFLAVALRKESVDRNPPMCITKQMPLVALRKESVDRNAAGSWRLAMNLLSLSARRAWIEIRCAGILSFWVCVALRKESVDRNSRGMNIILFTIVSLSARRAWIEITVVTAKDWASVVALRKESVDRNTNFARQVCSACRGRSPQGERG